MATDQEAPFEQVWSWVRRVPRGRVASYGQISSLMHRRLSAAAVGWAMRVAPANVPWHRVVNGRGELSTDRERPGVQRELLEREGIVFDADGRLDLARVGWKPRARRTRNET